MVHNAKAIEQTTDWVEVARALGEKFAERAAGHDRDGDFVADNYRDMRDRRLFSAGIPAELGGGGASYGELCSVVREIARHCGSTALSYSMHSHPVAANVYKYLRNDEGAGKALRKIASDELIISTTGANDWLESSGRAGRVDGGYRVNVHKRFVSGVPGAKIFVTSTVYEGPEGKEVIHFAVPLGSEGISIVETWDALGMRGTGSHDVVFENVFVPDAAVVLRRPHGKWHPVWDVVLPSALPLITSAYVGLAESAASMAVKAARHRGAELAPVVGEMTNALTVAQMTLDDMIRINDDHGFQPSLDVSSAVLSRKAIAADATKNTVELAAELVGGPGFFRGHPMERIVRDVRAMHFHPLPVRRQRVFSGRVALGYGPVEDD